LDKFYAFLTRPNQFSLDWGLGLVVFCSDCWWN